jgi:hypothetical protein
MYRHKANAQPQSQCSTTKPMFRHKAKAERPPYTVPRAEGPLYTSLGATPQVMYRHKTKGRRPALYQLLQVNEFLPAGWQRFVRGRRKRRQG